MIRRLAAGLAVAALTCAVTPSGAQEAVFVIRHAEKRQGDDPELTVAGRARAVAWAGMLGPAGIDAVLTTEARRTRQTGAIIAGALDVGHAELPMADIAGLTDRLVFDHAEDRVLVVGHTETIPAILSGLGVPEAIEIGQEEFDRLFIVAFFEGGAPSLVALRMPERAASP
jgi:phosphohistidine phosphatase SixA